ncbi:uncharacterized protein DNG_04236 [Cephalotrichum gorgonifer]|uniref:G-protein coupled receptors family 2 profile 2 domain-containing protein n=1 Tax=Cephalotrichum gorgonifer TaxID=2041049 RepID=A0AAE8MXL0_9PEZI|nr:uncharacterized protein DNG_04236 [Cephalotrichum gorgonifer]
METSMILPRQPALAAPTTASNIRTQSIVILTVSLVSVLGSLWMILSFACFKSMRSFRHYLILGLAISDCCMAFNFLLSSTMNVTGRLIGDPSQETFCSANGFLTQVFVVQTDYWVLTLAICTYFILADFKRPSYWVQDNVWILMAIPWVLSIAWASIGLALAGYGDIGAWCWFTSDKVRLLVNFVPRWIVIVAMLIMYSHLALVLHRAHGRFKFSSDYPSADQASSNSAALTGGAQSGSKSGVFSNSRSNGGPARHQKKPERNSRKFKKLARLMLIYPIAYMLIWVLPTAVRIFQSTKDTPAPFALQTIDKACIVIQGFVDAIIYGQFHTIVRWRDIKIEQHYYSQEHITEPELALAGASRGVDLVLFYIRTHPLFDTAASLAQSIYEVRRFDLLSPRTTIITKSIAILLPVLFMCLLKVETIRRSTVAFLIIANILIAIGIIGAMCLLLSIMVKYIHSKITLQSWFLPYGSRSTARLTDNDSYAVPVPKRNIYDRWLLLRFCIAFAAMRWL